MMFIFDNKLHSLHKMVMFVLKLEQTYNPEKLLPEQEHLPITLDTRPRTGIKLFS